MHALHYKHQINYTENQKGGHSNYYIRKQEKIYCNWFSKEQYLDALFVERQ